ncbi:MAG: hypothetical protein AMXMBFR58_09650 [Phycisphaerae bacterium]
MPVTTSVPTIGIIGMGFMGQTHLAAFGAAAAKGLCRVVAVADQDPQRRTGRVTTTGNLATGAAARVPLDLRSYAEPGELLADDEVGAVVICTPTDTHAELAALALRAGKHVLVEKPVALDVDSIRTVAAAAGSARRLCMPGMCMRFWPGWTWLKEAVESGRYGRVVSASFTRIGSRPTWAPEFYLNPARSGGALFDLHVHDVDVVYWLFGAPSHVGAVGDDFGVTAVYDFGRGGSAAPGRVTATGAWLRSPGFPFRMQFLVEFERATADFDLTRAPALRLIEGGEVREIPLPQGTAYEYEALEFIAAIREGREPAATLDDAAWVTAAILTERASQKAGGVRLELESRGGTM